MTTTESIPEIVAEFAARLEAAIEARVQARLMEVMGQVFGKQPQAGAAPRSVPAARKAAPSPGRILHGQYIGRLRKLKPAQRKQVMAVRQSEGVEAAIKLADKLAR